MEIHHPVPFDKEKRQNIHEKRLAAMIYFERFSFLITLRRCKYRKPRHGHSVLIIYHSKVYSVFLYCKLHWWNNELCRPCCSPGNLVNPLSWRLLSAKKDVAGKKKNCQFCLQICQPAVPWFCYVNVYCAPAEHLFWKFCVMNQFLPVWCFRQEPLHAQGCLSEWSLQYPQRRTQHTVHRFSHLLDFHV